MGRADDARRERESRRLAFPLRRTAGPASPSRFRLPGFPRALGAWATALGLAVLVAAPTPAAADPAPDAIVTLASNIGQQNHGATAVGFDVDSSQGFIIDRTNKWTLTSVDIEFEVGNPSGTPEPTYAVKIYSAYPYPFHPYVHLGTLTNPSSLKTGVNTFTAPGQGIPLDGSFSHFAVVVDMQNAGGRDVKVVRTGTTAEEVGFIITWSCTLPHDAGWGGYNGWNDSNCQQKPALKIAVRGYDRRLPGIPAAPVVSDGTAPGSLSVSWNTYPTDIDYDLRYYAGDADPADPADWVEEGEPGGHTHTGTATTATIAGLAQGTAHRVQVRARNGVGPGPWSDSGSATTGSTNTAPRLLQLGSNDGCEEKTAGTAFATLNLAANALISTTPLAGRDRCSGSDRMAPMFEDPDGDALTYSTSYTLPANVRFFDGIPRIAGPGSTEGGSQGRVFFRGVTAHEATDIRVDVTARDPHGATASTHVVLKGKPPSSTGAPRFAETTARRNMAVDVPVRWVLPAASGGDTTYTAAADATIVVPYDYAVSGLPAGLTFDAATRTVSGTPTVLGTYQVTYTADDADGAWSRKASPSAADTADAASQTVTVTVAEVIAAAATGAPTISGRTRAGETLTAATDGIADANGLTGAAFAFQWVSSANGTDTDIAGATGTSYALGRSDVGAAVKVRASFTDDAGFAETLTSAATAAVAPASLTASFHGLPASHNGKKRFEFELRFSEEVAGLKLAAVERALAVTGGRAVAVKRAVAGQIRRVTVQVRPDSTGAVTVALGATTDCAATDAVCAGDGRKLSEAVTATVPGPVVNAPATGAPTIAGTAQVGETLTASTAGIADANGLTGAAFAFQWVAVRDGTGTDIAGATASSYTLSHSDAGTAIRVRVSLTDDAGHAETLTSAVTAPVALPPLTAEFHGMPAAHDGSRRFEFEVRLSEEVAGLRLTAVQAALSVTNGQVVAVKRTVAGQNRSITVQVRPSGVDDVTVALPATADCSPAGAICTPDGRKLTSALTATVRGPVALSVADARASEGTDDALAFTVTLSRAAAGTVTVDYATRDGTATAGEDYMLARGTLTFAAAELQKTVSVPLLDDAVDEGEETFTLKLMNPQGAAIGDGEATGTIVNSDPLQKMWLSRFGRTVAGHVTAAVSDQLANPLAGAQVTVGGQSIDLAQTGDGAALTQALTGLARVLGASQGPAREDDPDGFPGSGPPVPASEPGGQAWAGLGVGETPASTGTPGGISEGRELVLGSAFHLATDGERSGPGLAAWGRVTVGGFDGKVPADKGDVSIDGTVTTGILGADAEWNRLLAGVAISVSEGEGTFDQPGVDKGSIESTMTTVSPYARMSLTDRVSVWGLAGWGTGEMTIVQEARAAADGRPERISRTDLEMRLAALGGRGALMQVGETGGFDLALKADAFFVETESDPISNEGKTTAEASGVRLALEGSRAFRMEGGGVLTPGLELGLRHDGGDAETGTGVELGGRVSYTDPETGLSVEARARTLVAHEDSDYREWGASGAVRLAPGERGRGLSFSLAPTYGAASSGVDRLWDAQDARGLAPEGEFEAAQSLQGELGYGLGLFGDRFTGTPNVGFGLSDTAREYRLGWRLTPVVPNDPGFEVNLDATRCEAATGTEPAEHGAMLRGAIRW